MANAVLDGVDGIVLGAETLRGLHPVLTVETVAKLCHAAERHFDYRWAAVVHIVDCFLRHGPRLTVEAVAKLCHAAERHFDYRELGFSAGSCVPADVPCRCLCAVLHPMPLLKRRGLLSCQTVPTASLSLLDMQDAPGGAGGRGV